MYAGVYDGHTKPSVCDYLVEHLHEYVLPAFSQKESRHE